MDSRRPDVFSALDRVLAPLTWLAAAFAVAVLVVGPELIGAKVDVAAQQPAPAATPAPTAAEGEETPAATETAAAGADGAAVFASAGCSGCHTLAAAGASGAVGPNLDDLQPDAATVKAIVTNGGGGMPAFGGDLSAEEIDAVAAYVADNAGG